MLSFPSSPTNGQSFKANDLITYKYNSAKNLWVRMSGGSEPGATGMQGATGPAGPVSGSDTQLIFNNAGVSGADSSLTFDKTAKVLTTPDIRLNAADNKIYGAATFKYLTLLPGDTNGIKFTSPTLPTELGISGPFTLEAFIQVTDITAPFVILTAENGLWGGYSYRGDFSFEWRSDLGTIAFGWHSLMYYDYFVQPPTNSFIPDPTKWYHVAVTRDVNNDYFFFVDGVCYPATSNDGDSSTGAHTINTQAGANPAYLIIGHFSYSPSQGGTGGVKSIRLVKDTQVYTTNFSPPAISKDLTLTQAANVNGYPSAAITGINTVVLIAQGDTINDLTAYGRTSSKYTSTAENTIVTGTSTTIPEIRYDGSKWQTTEIAVNGNLTSSKYSIGSVSTGISAAGTTQATATLITTDTNIVTIASSGTTAIKLPVSIPGMKIYIKNTSAVALSIFPNTGANINALAANAAYSQAAGIGAFYIASSYTQWYSQ